VAGFSQNAKNLGWTSTLYCLHAGFVNPQLALVKTRAAGGNIRSPQRQLWVGIGESIKALEERHKIDAPRIYIARIRGLGFNFLIGFPQVALWANDMASAAPTVRCEALSVAKR